MGVLVEVPIIPFIVFHVIVAIVGIGFIFLGWVLVKSSTRYNRQFRETGEAY